MAEATLMKVSVVSIDLSKLAAAQTDDIPSPRVFYDMESASTFDCVLPGANIVRPDVEGDTPKRFFRQTAFEAFSGRLDSSHETLIETVRGVVGGSHAPTRPANCPVEECAYDLSPGIGVYTCGCNLGERLFETDAFRFRRAFQRGVHKRRSAWRGSPCP